MAIVSSFEEGTRNVAPHPTTVEAEYQAVPTRDGKWLLQISTFGSSDRQSEPKVSQTLQFDEARAQELVMALRKTFPGPDEI